jgi:hypothetical protein
VSGRLAVVESTPVSFSLTFGMSPELMAATTRVTRDVQGQEWLEFKCGGCLTFHDLLWQRLRCWLLRKWRRVFRSDDGRGARGYRCPLSSLR